MTPKTVLNIKSITKNYPTHPVLNAISLNVKEGEIIGFIGLNGTGKTTLIKAILDLVRTDTGTITIFGKTNSSLTSKRKLSYLPEKFTPSPLLTGKELLKLSCIQKRHHFCINETKNILQQLDFPICALGQQIRHYSKGMTQKIGLAATFLTNSPLLILDEPMSGLDPLTRTKLKNLLISYKKSGKTVFFSSHILSDIDEICDKVVILHNHKITFIGSPKELKKEYKTTKLENAFLQAITN